MLKSRRAGPSPWGMALKVISAFIRPELARPLTSPILATVELTRKCNLECFYCESRNGRGGGAASEWLSPFVEEIAAAGVAGLGFTGGEPLLHPRFEEVASSAAAAGLITHLNTNGTLVTPARAHKILDARVASINVSLDGAEAACHDRLRGRESFSRAAKGVEALVKARDVSGADTRILLAMTLSEENAHQALDILKLSEDLGADGCTYLPRTSFHSPLRRPGSPRAADAARALAKRAADPRIDNSKKYLAGMVRFFQGLDMPLRCSALHSSILASPDGKLYPCVPSAVRDACGLPYQPGALMPLFKSGVLGSCLEQDLCAGCWWNCHREIDLALGVIG